MGLRKLQLREQYRSDQDSIVTEFFFPCLGACIEYDRCVKYASLKSLTALAMGFDNFAGNGAKMRIITGHRFGAYDLETMSGMFGSKRQASKDIRDAKLAMLKRIIDSGQLEMKVAVSGSEGVSGSFSESTGIFRDGRDDAVAFTGTSSEMISAPGSDFESIDVFTSWNDGSRVEAKSRTFEDLWAGRVGHLDVVDFGEAIRNNVAKYSMKWALGH